MKKLVIHQSHMATAGKCQEQFRRGVINGERRPPGVALIVGGPGFHDPAAKDATAKKETGSLLSLEEVRDLARDGVTNGWESTLEYSDGPLLNEVEEAKGPEVVKAEAVDTAVSLVSLYHEELAPSLMPDKIEFPWVLKLDGFPFDIAGTMDLIESPLILDEWKTAAQAPPKDRAEKSLQLSIYAMACSFLPEIQTIPPIRLGVFTKSKTPAMYLQDTTRTKQDFGYVIRRLEALALVVDNISRGILYPADTESYLCNPRYCGFFRTCEYVRH